jgi:hypothetical protein
MFATSAKTFVDEPTSTEVAIETTVGVAFKLTIQCNNPLGCQLRHSYDDEACDAATKESNVESDIMLAKDSTTEIALCGSSIWADGVHITLPLATASLASSPVTFSSAGQTLGFPYSPITSISPTLAGKASAVPMSLTTLVKDGADPVEYWSASAVAQLLDEVSEER